MRKDVVLRCWRASPCREDGPSPGAVNATRKECQRRRHRVCSPVIRCTRASDTSLSVRTVVLTQVNCDDDGLQSMRWSRGRTTQRSTPRCRERLRNEEPMSEEPAAFCGPVGGVFPSYGRTRSAGATYAGMVGAEPGWPGFMPAITTASIEVSARVVLQVSFAGTSWLFALRMK